MNCTDPTCPCRQQNDWILQQRCSLSGAMLLYVPPGGTHISCPVHGQHFLQGSSAVCGHTSLIVSNNLTARIVC